jgi:hypothetical protein
MVHTFVMQLVHFSIPLTYPNNFSEFLNSGFYFKLLDGDIGALFINALLKYSVKDITCVQLPCFILSHKCYFVILEALIRLNKGI